MEQLLQRIKLNFSDVPDPRGQSAPDTPRVASSALTEDIDDRVAALLVAGTNITLNYNDVAGTLTISASGGLSDGNKGDITVASSGTAWTINADAVTNTKLANMATATFKGRVSAGTGDPEDLTGTQATTLLDVFTTSLKGLAPASGGGTTNFLRADGTWAAPTASVGFTTVEVNLGSLLRKNGRFTISGSGWTVGKPVLIRQAVGPYTGKGTRADEAEMDGLEVSASVTAANTITAYWATRGRVRGNFKFDYLVGA